MSDFIFRLEQIKHVAQAFWKQNKQKKIWAFYADMGCGKTTFIGNLCEDVLKIKSHISSPTFSIINEYESAVVGTVYHMDWYRLQDVEEAVNAGVEDTLNSQKLCLIEWPEKAENILPDDTLKIFIEVLDDNTRRIYTKSDD